MLGAAQARFAPEGGEINGTLVPFTTFAAEAMPPLRRMATAAAWQNQASQKR